MELNPNHKVVTHARHQWHKIAAIIMLKLGVKEVQITIEDVMKIQDDVAIVLDARNEAVTGVLTVRLVDNKTADELARKEGGRTIDN